MNPDLDSRATREVIELEAFLEEWISGRAENDESAFSRFSGVLAEGFHIVPIPGYPTLDREGLISYMRRQYGTDASTSRWVEDIRIGHVGRCAIVVFYDEWQVRDGEQKESLVSATLVQASDGPNGLHWAHIHETPIDPTGG